MVYGREYFFGSRGVESCNPVSGSPLVAPRVFIVRVSNAKSKFGCGLKIEVPQLRLGSVIGRVCLCRSVKLNFCLFQGVTALREPVKKITLGETQVPYTVFIDYLGGLSQSTYA